MSKCSGAEVSGQDEKKLANGMEKRIATPATHAVTAAQPQASQRRPSTAEPRSTLVPVASEAGLGEAPAPVMAVVLGQMDHEARTGDVELAHKRPPILLTTSAKAKAAKTCASTAAVAAGPATQSGEKPAATSQVSVTPAVQVPAWTQPKWKHGICPPALVAWQAHVWGSRDEDSVRPASRTEDGSTVSAGSLHDELEASDAHDVLQPPGEFLRLLSPWRPDQSEVVPAAGWTALGWITWTYAPSRASWVYKKSPVLSEGHLAQTLRASETVVALPESSARELLVHWMYKLQSRVRPRQPGPFGLHYVAGAPPAAWPIWLPH